MTPHNDKEMTAEDRAAMILDAISLETDKYFARGIISKQIELAEQAAYERGIEDAARCAMTSGYEILAKEIRSLKKKGV